MKKKLLYFCSIVLTTLLMICGCGSLFVDQAVDTAQEERQRARESLHQGRPENAERLPDLSRNISELRIQVIPRPYDPPSDFEDLQKITLMQIWYGYYAGGSWYDHPCENYDLRGIFEYDSRTGWKAGIGSHITKIGPYLLICVTLEDDPLVECQIQDTLYTEVLYPFSKYNTYHYYIDETGRQYYYMDTHDHGYGYIAEDPSSLADPEKAVCIMRGEFPQRYYLILDYAALPEDYVLTVSRTSTIPEKEDIQTLTYSQIQELLR